MTGTLTGFLIYRVQASLKEQGYPIPYQELITALTTAAHALSLEMATGETIELPNGDGLQMTR